VLPVMARFGFFAGTRRVHFGTGGHARRLGTSAKNCSTLDRSHGLGKLLQVVSSVVRTGTEESTSFAREGVDDSLEEMPLRDGDRLRRRGWIRQVHVGRTCFRIQASKVGIARTSVGGVSSRPWSA
jgi:hypothetical protein